MEHPRPHRGRSAAAVITALALAFTGLTAGATAATAAPAAAPVTAAPAADAVTHAKKAKKKKKTSIKITSRSTAKTEVGKTLTFKGKASSSLKKKRVQLQIKVGKSWRTVKNAKVQSNRTFTIKAKATKAGKQYYRVYAPATKQTKASKSTSMGFTVWKWYDLAGTDVDRSRLVGSWYEEKYGAKIGGKNYRKSAIMGWALGGYNDPGWAEYNVNYRCTTFRATVGMHDQSKSTAKRSFSIGIDDSSVDFGTRGVGAGKAVSTKISGAYRIRLNSQLTGDGTGSAGWGLGVFGTPQVYCSTKP